MLIEYSTLLQRIQPKSWVDPRLEVRRSPIHDRGLFATAPIKRDEVLIVWGGTFFTIEDILAGKAVEHGYAAIRAGLFLGHTVEEGNSDDDFMNHSCDPNIWMTDEITWVARRDISAGEEVTGDCAMYWGDDGGEQMTWECRCGSPQCRKRFTTEDWRRTDLQERYGDHFAPYINEHIQGLLESREYQEE
jgi:hypothetical protein